MIYFLQDPAESDSLRIEIEELKEVLDERNTNKQSGGQYQVVTSDYFKNYDNKQFSRDLMKNHAIPVGSIEFVQSYLHEFHNIEQMNSIEIPECLRLPHLLLRDYKIVRFDQIPREGEYFVKDVSQPKGFTYFGHMKWLFSYEHNREAIDQTHMFQVSGPLDIIAEYRVIVMGTKIYGIQFYDGKPTIMPTPNEIIKIQEAVARYSVQKDRALAYAMDVAVVKVDNEIGRDLALLEMHPYCACGSYGCRGEFLPELYRHGLRWYIEHNAPITLK